MKKVKNVIICDSEIDKRAAAYLADHLQCEVISTNLLPAEILDEVFENVYVIGSSAKPTAKAKNIVGSDRYDTCARVIGLIKKIRRGY